MTAQRSQSHQSCAQGKWFGRGPYEKRGFGLPRGPPIDTTTRRGLGLTGLSDLDSTLTAFQ
jgi:hypothetical protein